MSLKRDPDALILLFKEDLQNFKLYKDIFILCEELVKGKAAGLLR
jgi:hypothetical protein